MQNAVITAAAKASASHITNSALQPHNGMKIEEVIRVINDINKEFEITGLTVAEPVPRYAIKLRNMLKQLPLI